MPYWRPWPISSIAHCWGRCRHYSRNYEAQRASGRKYVAQIAIFRILATVDRFSWISWKVESHWGKLESHWGKQKVVEESRKPLMKVGKPLRKIGFCARKIGFWARKILIFPKRFSSFWQFWGLVLLRDFYHVCARIYFVELKYSQLKWNHHSDTPSTKGDWRWNLQWCDYQGRQVTRRSSLVPFFQHFILVGY